MLSRSRKHQRQRPEIFQNNYLKCTLRIFSPTHYHSANDTQLATSNLHIHHWKLSPDHTCELTDLLKWEISIILKLKKFVLLIPVHHFLTFHFLEINRKSHGSLKTSYLITNPECLEVVSSEVCRTQDSLHTKASFTDTFDEAAHPSGSHDNLSLKKQ